MKKIALIAAAVLLLAACSLASAQQWQHVSSPGSGRFAVDPQGTLWQTTGSTLSRWTGNGWQTETIPGAPGTSNAHLTFSADGSPHIACVDGNEIWYFKKGASGWSKIEYITNNSAWGPGNSSIAVDSTGKPYVVWSQNNNQWIYLSSRNSNGTWIQECIDNNGNNAGWWPEMKI